MDNQILLARQLEYFKTLYRVRNYAAAARAIPITYQGLRKAIAKLEGNLGINLFEEAGEGSTLTPTQYGDLLYQTAMKWSQDIKDLRHTIDLMSRDERSRVSLCTVVGSMGILGYHLVSDFNHDHTSLQIDAFEYSDEWVDQALLSEEFGLGIVASPFEEGLFVHKLASIGCSVWVPRTHPLASRQSLTLADFDGQSITLPEPHFKSHAFYRERFRELGVQPSSIMHCSDMYWSYMFALEGRGLGLYIDAIESLMAPNNQTVLLPLEDGYVRTLGIAYRCGHVLSPQENVVFNYFVQSAETKLGA